MPTRTHLDRFAIGLMILFCTIWGVQQVAVKIANAGISPVWQAGLRSMGAAVLVWAWAMARGVRLFERDGTLWPGLIAGLLFSGEFALLFWALEFTTASRGVIFLYTAPFVVALGAGGCCHRSPCGVRNGWAWGWRLPAWWRSLARTCCGRPGRRGSAI